MVSLVLVTHESLGESLIKCARHIMCAPIPHLTHLIVPSHADPDEVCKEAKDLLKQVDEGEGVLLLTDIFGGTPSNIANRLIVPGKIEAIAGVNLPMLVRAITYSDKPLDVVIKKALLGGQDGVIYIKPFSKNTQ